MFLFRVCHNVLTLKSNSNKFLKKHKNQLIVICDSCYYLSNEKSFLIIINVFGRTKGIERLLFPIAPMKSLNFRVRVFGAGSIDVRCVRMPPAHFRRHPINRNRIRIDVRHQPGGRSEFDPSGSERSQKQQKAKGWALCNLGDKHIFLLFLQHF